MVIYEDKINRPLEQSTKRQKEITQINRIRNLQGNITQLLKRFR